MQYFTDTFTIPSGMSSVNVNLLDSGVERAIKAEGCWAPDNTLNGRTYTFGSINNSAGSNTAEAYFTVGVGNSNNLRVTVASNPYSGRTGAFELVVYYTKS